MTSRKSTGKSRNQPLNSHLLNHYLQQSSGKILKNYNFSLSTSTQFEIKYFYFFRNDALYDHSSQIIHTIYNHIQHHFHILTRDNTFSSIKSISLKLLCWKSKTITRQIRFLKSSEGCRARMIHNVNLVEKGNLGTFGKNNFSNNKKQISYIMAVSWY